tara:strand:+ start:27745 stop:29010 length:1266 start_codon:yes stop_codon:yes gene_type:complete
MPRTTKPLSDLEVKQAKPRDKEYTLWDGGGLCLRVKPSGSKSWILSYYRPTNGKRANISFGKYPAVSLTNARDSRHECLTLLAQGLDPQNHKSEQEHLKRVANSNTLEQVAHLWLKVKRSKVSEDYADDVLRSLERHVFPTLGAIPIHKLTARDVIAELQPISAKGTHETVKRICQRLGEVMDYAMLSGLIDSNPLTGISKAFEAPRKQNMPTLQPDELSGLMLRINQASIRISTRCLIEWQLHTMVRPSEAAGARWEEIDFEKALWTIPASRMKKRKAHTVPLSPQSLAILERMKPISGNREHVFPGDRNPKAHTHRQTANMAIKRMGYTGELVAHGLRSIASTTLNEQGFDPDVIESALAHTDKNEVRAAYNRAEYLERRRTMMYWWSDFIDAATTGRAPRSGTKHLRVVGSGPQTAQN